MTNFDADILRELRDLQEVAIRTDKHPNTAVVIWVGVADEEVFVRSVRGLKGRWYRDLAAGGPATLEFGGRRLAVQASPAWGLLIENESIEASEQLVAIRPLLDHQRPFTEALT